MHCLFAALLLLTSSACGSSHDPSSEDGGPPPPDGDEVDADMDPGCIPDAPECVVWSGECCSVVGEATCVRGSFVCAEGTEPGSMAFCSETCRPRDGGVGFGEVPCGPETCTLDEYCVQPCCGGPAPMCLMREPDGTCPPGATEGPCFDPGSGPAWGCTMMCTPPPAFCAPLSNCEGDDCPPAGGCFGGFYDPATRVYSCACA